MVEVEEVELDLGLSIGGAFRKPVEKEKEKEKSEPELGQNQIQSNAMQKVDQNQEAPVKNENEIHALKRKREQKNATGNGGFEPVLKKEKTERVNGGAVPVNAPFHVVQPQQLGKVKFVPFSNGMNGMALPCWFGGEKNVGGFDGVNVVNGGDGKVKSNGSSSRCSSVVSDYQSSSREDGGSTESHSQHSANSLTVQTQLKNSKEINLRRNQPEQIASSKPLFNNVKGTQTHQSTMKPNEDSAATTTATATQTIPVPSPNPVKKPLSLSQMPYVSTKGNGPNGKTVNGFLYRYSKCDEVSIVCVCHGSTFSPAEFVQHAGGTDISHPLRHITVNSSAFQ
ncbi:ninja-family protein Os03g0419100 [Vicia villosa]|uniref:ninja-family protein Os03g0419100 n=1 Tax=Vicia villosa TaxID=3911 RepID=UPI00273AEA3B|nr:ninja-family protein Os03g0419100 [Vicia villosa]